MPVLSIKAGSEPPLWPAFPKYESRQQPLRADGLIEREVARVADLDDDRALDRVASAGEGHLSRYAFEFLDLGHRGSDIFPSFFRSPVSPPVFWIAR